MEPLKGKMKVIKSLQEVDRKVIAMCTHDNAIFIATEHEVYRLIGDAWEQLQFRIVE